MSNTAPRRARMTGEQRREQLLVVGRTVFAQRGYDAATVEEIAAVAGVSKPIVYEHFGGKEGLFALVVEGEIQELLGRITTALTGERPRELVEQAALALLGYIEENTDGFRILVRDSPVASVGGSFASLISEIATRVEHIFAAEFAARELDPSLAGLYSQALVGMVALTGQWWCQERTPAREVVAAHLVNLAWNGLAGLEANPALRLSPSARPA